MSRSDKPPLSLRRMWVKTGLLFFTVLLVSGTVVGLSEVVRHERLSNEAIRLAADQGQLIQRQINQGLSAVYAIAALVRQGNGQVSDFERVASSLLRVHESLDSLQLAPDAVVRQIVPLKGNEKAIGHDLLGDAARSTEVRQAIETQKLTLAGPFELVQGGYAIVGRLPVFLDDPNANDSQRFWGLTIGLIRVDKLIHTSALERLPANGYHYELWREHPDSHEREIFARSSSSALIQPHDFGFNIPNGHWILSIAPRSGWVSTPVLVGKVVAAAAVSVLLALLGYAIFKQPLVLRRMVKERTRELAAANEALQRSNDSLHRSEQKFRSFVETASDTIYTLDTQGRFQYVSPACKVMLGSDPEAWLGRSFADLLHPDDLPAFCAFFQRVLEERTRQSGVEYRARHIDGDWRWNTSNAAPLLNQENELVGMIGIGRDISKRKANEARIFRLAHFDSLTDLPNRSLFSDRLQQALQMAQRNHEQVTLMCVDLDRFKPINDTWGHAVGDEVLKQVAQRMVSCVRASDTVGRIGGDEFVVLLPESHNAEEILRVAEKIRASLAEDFIVGDLRLSISSCIGVAIYPEHGSDPTTLARSADQAMYVAKETGRNRVCVFGQDYSKPPCPPEN